MLQKHNIARHLLKTDKIYYECPFCFVTKNYKGECKQCGVSSCKKQVTRAIHQSELSDNCILDEDNNDEVCMLKKFITHHGHFIFYFEDIQEWVRKNYSKNHSTIINRMLNNDNIIELGDSAYEYAIN